MTARLARALVLVATFLAALAAFRPATAAEAIEARSVRIGAFSELKQASDQVDRELERAKARMEDAQGSDADREFERLSEDARIAEERARYDAERNGGTKSE